MNEHRNASSDDKTRHDKKLSDDPLLESFSYDDQIVRMFSTATLIWGIVATLVGLIVAILLVVPQWTFIEYISFGRLRPLHGNLVGGFINPLVAAILMPISSLTVVAISLTTGPGTGAGSGDSGDSGEKGART